jgi:hypothetical protein
MAHQKLSEAKRAKVDEFYTRYHDIEKEMSAYIDLNPDVFKGKTILLPCDDPEWSNFTKYFSQNFQRFKIKKVISTSFATESKKYKIDYQPTLFEKKDPKFDKRNTRIKGKIFTLTKDKTGDGKINIDDIEWRYLNNDGDFRSDEITKLRNEADIIITNPPFSQWREFISWITEANKQFVIIGNINAISYKEVFPLLKNNKIWIGATNFNTGMYFGVPKDFVYASSYKFEKEQDGIKVNRVPGVCWFSNIDHGRRHVPLQLMSMQDNLKYSKHKEIKGKKYHKYNNYDAIEVPYADSIPSDYKGTMGVPISFLNKYNPDQFEIIGNGQTMADELGIRPVGQKFVDDYYNQGNKGQINSKWNNLVYYDGKTAVVPYQRILIRHKKI